MTWKISLKVILIVLLVQQMRSQCVDQRTVRLDAVSMIGNLKLLSEYVREGVVSAPFAPTQLAQSQQGKSVYYHTPNTTAGTSGFVKLQMGTSDKFLIVYFQNQWEGTSKAAVCVQSGLIKMLSRDSDLYDEIYGRLNYGLTPFSGSTFNKLSCSWTDLNGDTPLSLKLDAFGNRVQFNAKMALDAPV